MEIAAGEYLFPRKKFFTFAKVHFTARRTISYDTPQKRVFSFIDGHLHASYICSDELIKRWLKIAHFIRHFLLDTFTSKWPFSPRVSYL